MWSSNNFNHLGWLFLPIYQNFTVLTQRCLTLFITTRWFWNHESRLKIHQSLWIQWPFCKNLNQRSLTPRWPLIPHLLRSYVWIYPRIIVSKSHENTSKYVDTMTFFAKNLNQRSLTPRWPLTPHLSRSHVWLYPRIIVSKSHGNTSMYVDTVMNTVDLFAKTWTKGHWPLDDLWPHICWGHMCDSTQGSLCPKSHGNTSMYVDTVMNTVDLFAKTWTKGHWPLDDLVSTYFDVFSWDLDTMILG